mmetsp:Transcript_70613/g.147901  ORF Transcript_70613/g.147901 Transcript_70613/m.147901 type:complete len:272 (+) Transcript_70613:296-1111(+)
MAQLALPQCCLQTWYTARYGRWMGALDCCGMATGFRSNHPDRQKTAGGCLGHGESHSELRPSRNHRCSDQQAHLAGLVLDLGEWYLRSPACGERLGATHLPASETKLLGAGTLDLRCLRRTVACWNHIQQKQAKTGTSSPQQHGVPPDAYRHRRHGTLWRRHGLVTTSYARVASSHLPWLLLRRLQIYAPPLWLRLLGATAVRMERSSFEGEGPSSSTNRRPLEGGQTPLRIPSDCHWWTVKISQRPCRCPQWRLHCAAQAEQPRRPVVCT